MENSTTRPNGCDMMPGWYWRATEGIFLLTYHIIAPLNFVFGLTGHAIFLFVCTRERRREKAYTYQVLLTVSEILELITGGSYNVITALYGLAGAERKGLAADWVSSQYWIMWYYATLSSPLMGIFVNLCLLFSACMALDRVIALAKPYKYRFYNHRLYQAIASCVSVTLAVSANIIDCFRKTAGPAGPKQYRVVNSALTIYRTPIPNALLDTFHQLRNVPPAVGLVVLLVCNSLIVYLYRVKTKQVAAMMDRDRAKEAQRKEREKTLLLLAVYQSVFNFVAVTYNISYRLFVYFAPTLGLCGSYLMVPIQHCVYMIAYGFDFYIMLLINQRFRTLMRRRLNPRERTRTAPALSGSTRRSPRRSPRDLGRSRSRF